jgi:hypothetical protein
MEWQSTPMEQRDCNSGGPEKAMGRPIAVCSYVDGVLEMGTLYFLIASASS